MDHPAEFTEPQPWRAAAMIAAAIATVELFILLLVAFVFGAKLFTSQTATATVAAIKREQPQAASASHAKENKTATKHHTTPAGPLPRQKTSVIVLNGNGIPGAAATTADRAHSFRYIITATGNAPRTDFPRSLVMFRSGFRAAAARLAKDMGIKRVTPLDGIEKSDLQGAQLALIIGG